MKKIKFIVVLLLGLNLLFAFSATAGPVLDRIMEKGELVVGTSGDQPPLTAKTKEGKIIGMDADLARLMASAMGVELRLEAMQFSKLLPALQAGKVDMVLSGMTITAERNLQVAFVGPYFVSGKGILAKIEKIASSENTADINRQDFSLAVLKGSTSEVFAKKFLNKARLTTTETLDRALNLLFEDKVDAVVADYPFCAVAAFRNKQERLIAGEARFTYEPLGIALSSKDPLLVNWVENFLDRLEGSGNLDILTLRWFESSSWMEQLPEKP
jgi:polar amino acid transport system substrate-binding protein